MKRMLATLKKVSLSWSIALFCVDYAVINCIFDKMSLMERTFKKLRALMSSLVKVLIRTIHLSRIVYLRK